MLAWFRRSFGISSANRAGAGANLGHGGFNFEVVGEQSYQNHLRKVSAGRVERENASLLDAVSVTRSTLTPMRQRCALKSMALARSAFQELERGGDIAECQGVLVGGQPDKPSFGIYLDFKPKLLGSLR
jgi:hypothetical protein